jgi:hypothetical protein
MARVALHPATTVRAGARVINQGGNDVAEQTVVHTGENSPEYVAYRLLVDIARTEGKPLSGPAAGKADRKWILDTYAECLSAVRIPSGRNPKKAGPS